MKKFLSMVMAAAMVVSLVPATAFAASDDVKATAKVVDSKNYTQDEIEKDNVISGPELQLTFTTADYTTDVYKRQEEMMAYLYDKREELQVTVPIGGEELPFFSEKEIRHMVDVKNLFSAGLDIRNGCVVFTLAAAIIMFAKKKGRTFLRTPVSYTHLDVYKRQPNGFILLFTRQRLE